ncbi:MAG: substrate-binding domain-containing protein [Protaetiibacter sp.]
MRWSLGGVAAPRALAAGAVVGLACAGLAACTPAADGPPVAVLFPGGTDDDWGASAEVLRQELADDGYVVEVRFAGDDIPRQLEQLREVLAAKPAAVVLAPVDETAISAVLSDNTTAGVSIIAYDDLILNSDQVDYFASFDHRAAGRLQARALLDGLGLADDPDAGPFAVELLASSGDDRAAQDAFAGALELLQPYLDAGRLTVPSGRTGLEQAAILRGDPAVAAERVAELLDAGVPLAGVLSPSDAMSAAVAEVLAAEGVPVVAAGGGWTASPVPPDGEPSDAPSTPPPPDASIPPNTDAGPDAASASAASGSAASAADGLTPVVLTGGGSTLDGARAVREGTQSSTVYEDPRALARAVANMVREVVGGGAPTLTEGATTDNGIREVPTLLVEPQLVATIEDAVALL